MGDIEARLKKLERATAPEKPVYLIVVEDGQEFTEEQKLQAIASAEDEARRSPKGLHYPLAVFLDR